VRPVLQSEAENGAPRRVGRGQTAGVFERLETERLALRAITADDVDLLVALDGDPAVMRFINGGRPSTRAEVQDTVQRALGHRWVAYDRATDEFVGWFGMRPSKEHARERYLGYRLRRTAWGVGLATEGSQALIAEAFARDTERILAQTMTVNARSRRVMERCGLRFLRTFFEHWDEPIGGGELGDVEYELAKPDWDNRRA
jgi:RimJ/RimL family protein N-acetyltransferase